MTKQTNAAGKKPTHRLFRVEGEGKAARWTEIGAAWAHQDGNGFAISCNSVPLEGRIVMRKATARQKSEAA